jgi:hypothetical protein
MQPRNSPEHRCAGLGAALLLSLWTVLSPNVWAADDFSHAEIQLFMKPHLQALKLPSQLNYLFQKSGSHEQSFEDRVQLSIKPTPKGGCCLTKMQFLSGERRLQLPDPEEVLGNPVILYFLERDIRDMQRLTSGKSNYFRSRIRKALSFNASERNIKLYFKGQSVEGLEFEIVPFADDPLRSRFEQWADKHYVFTFSSQVPGAVVAIRTWVKKPTEMKTIWQESLLLEGASL